MKGSIFNVPSSNPICDNILSILGSAVSGTILSPLRTSEIHIACEPCNSIIPRSVANSTAESICVSDFASIQISRVIGCRAMYVPVFETSKAHTPSSVKAYRGNCPNCPSLNAFTALHIPLISPVPIVLIPERGKKKGLFTSLVYILLGSSITSSWLVSSSILKNVSSCKGSLLTMYLSIVSKSLKKNAPFKKLCFSNGNS